jgi:hypothetical protein
VAESQTDGIDGGWVERILAGNGANAIGAEEQAGGYGHGLSSGKKSQKTRSVG